MSADPYGPHLFDKVPGPWWDLGACKGHDGELWFPESNTPKWKTEQAKRICADCDYQAECLEFAEQEPFERYGIWGGLTTTERRDWRKQTKTNSNRRTTT